MKHLMSFNLPDDAEELKMAMNGANLQFAIDEFYNDIRSMLKYEDATKYNEALADVGFDVTDKVPSFEDAQTVAQIIRQMLINRVNERLGE